MPYRSCLLLLVCSALLASAHATTSCQLNTASPSVTICAPGSGASVTSPVEVNAGTTDTASRVTLLQIYVDGTKKFEIAADNLDTSLSMAVGTHRVTVQAKDASGAVFKSTVNISVTGSGGPAACTLDTASPSVTISDSD